MVETADFLSALNRVAAEKPAYRAGGSGKDGTCDCIGLIIGALRRCGYRWPGIHGSNWAARNAVKDLAPLKRSGLYPGCLVFKAREPGDPARALPSRYASHPDQRDYYHVGVVVSASPLVILHVSTPGVCRDNRTGAWRYAAGLTCLKGDDTPVNVPPYAAARVTAENGLPVKLRHTASTSLPYLDKLPVGTEVTLLEYGEKWCRVRAGSRDGYIMTRFLDFIANGEEATRA